MLRATSLIVKTQGRNKAFSRGANAVNLVALNSCPVADPELVEGSPVEGSKGRRVASSAPLLFEAKTQSSAVANCQLPVPSCHVVGVCHTALTDFTAGGYGHGEQQFHTETQLTSEPLCGKPLVATPKLPCRNRQDS